MTTHPVRIASTDLAARRLVVEPVEHMPPFGHGDHAIMIDQAVADRTLAFDAELVTVDPVTGQFTFKARGNRSGGRGVDVLPGDLVRLMMRHHADPGDGIRAVIPGQADVGHGLADQPPVVEPDRSTVVAALAGGGVGAGTSDLAALEAAPVAQPLMFTLDRVHAAIDQAVATMVRAFPLEPDQVLAIEALWGRITRAVDALDQANTAQDGDQ